MSLLDEQLKEICEEKEVTSPLEDGMEWLRKWRKERFEIMLEAWRKGVEKRWEDKDGNS